MQINDLIKRISKGYPDNYIAEACWDFEKERPQVSFLKGDLLAFFIAVEIFETYDAGVSTEAQLVEAERALERAKDQINDALYGMWESADKSS